MRFLRATGIRLGELRAVTWPMVDLEGGLLVLDRANGRQRVVTLSTEASRILWEIRTEQQFDYQGIVFLNNEGRGVARTTLGENLRRLKERCGITGPGTLHGMRHALGARALAGGADLALVSTQLGHSCSAITRKLYARVSNPTREIRAAIAKGETPN